MKVTCPHCGKSVVVNGIGRPSLNVPVTKVCDTLQLYHSVTVAAKQLKVSRPYIYKVLKADGMTPADVLRGKSNEV